MAKILSMLATSASGGSITIPSCVLTHNSPSGANNDSDNTVLEINVSNFTNLNIGSYSASTGGGALANATLYLDNVQTAFTAQTDIDITNVNVVKFSLATDHGTMSGGTYSVTLSNIVIS